jgi:hypothetical protein
LNSILDYCKATGIEFGDLLKIWFYYRSAILGLYVEIDQIRKNLILRAPEGREIDFSPDAKTGMYRIPIAHIRALEKIPRTEAESTESKGGKTK